MKNKLKNLGLAACFFGVASCEHLKEITPEEAARGAEAARVWLEVIKEAKEIVVHPEK